MGRGIKASKNIVFDVTYEVYPKSGPTKEESETKDWAYIDTYSDYYQDYYIVGAGQEQLPEAWHEPVMVDKVGYEVSVDLEKKGNLDKKPIWNKNLVNGVFSGAISEISSDEFDDLNLKAKWTQTLFTSDMSFNETNLEQQFVTFENNNVIFSWSMTNGGN